MTPVAVTPTPAPLPYQWFLFQADLDPTRGREQAGVRPVLVVSTERLNTLYDVVMAVPLTSRKNDRPARVGEVLLPAGTGGLRVDSFALCFQARALDKRRLGRRYGQITDEAVRDAIRHTLARCLDLP
jgi:mRNA interferase MazF